MAIGVLVTVGVLVGVFVGTLVAVGVLVGVAVAVGGGSPRTKGRYARGSSPSSALPTEGEHPARNPSPSFPAAAAIAFNSIRLEMCLLIYILKLSNSIGNRDPYTHPPHTTLSMTTTYAY